MNVLRAIMLWFDLHSVDNKEHSVFSVSFTAIYFQLHVGLSSGVFLRVFRKEFCAHVLTCVCSA